MNKEQYTCAMCEKTYNKGWLDEEAEDELSEAFPGFDKSKCDLVCDNCYEKLGLKA